MATCNYTFNDGTKIDGMDGLKDYLAKPGNLENLLGASKVPENILTTSRVVSEQHGMVRSTIESIKKEWGNAPPIKTFDSMSDPLLPEEVIAHNQEVNSRGDAGVVDGFYYKGVAYINLNLNTPDKVATTLLHEVFGHHGLRKLLGESLTPTLRQVANLYPSRIAEIIRNYQMLPGVDANTISNSQILEMASDQVRNAAAEEHLSFIAQTNPTSTIIAKIISIIRSWLRNNIPMMENLSLSHSEIIENVITPAANIVKNSPLNSTRVSDVNGEPIVMARSFPSSPFNVQPTFNIAEQSTIDKIIAYNVNSFNRVYQVQKAIEDKLNTKIFPHNDARLALTNQPGRTSVRLEDATNRMFKPLVEEITNDGLTIESVSELAVALHAQERNEKIAVINPIFDINSPSFGGVEGSGINTSDANEIIKKYASDPRVEGYVKRLQEITKLTLVLKHEYGLITDSEFRSLNSGYKNYVPLKGHNNYGVKNKRALGHNTRDEHIFENIFRDYQMVVAAGEKNKARIAFASMVITYPDSSLWTVDVPPKDRRIANNRVVVLMDKSGIVVGIFDTVYEVDAFITGAGKKSSDFDIIDESGKQVVEFVKQVQDHEVIAYSNGIRVRIQVYDEALARQMNLLDEPQMGVILNKMRSVNRWLTKAYTAYSPDFIVMNPLRDITTGTINIIGDHGAVTYAKAIAKYPSALRGMYAFARTGSVLDNPMGDALVRYRAAGGKTGAGYVSDLDEQLQDIQRIVEDTTGALKYLSQGDTLKAIKVGGRKLLMALASTIEHLNQATENALRLAVFKTLIDSGVVDAKAAAHAKNVTVDFDRRGSQTRVLAAHYMFINPAIQGTANVARVLSNGEHNHQAWAVLGGLVALGALTATMGMGDDEDKWLGEDWSTRSKKVVLQSGNTKISLPMSYEYAPFYALGVALAEYTHGKSSSIKTAARVTSSFIDAYVPFKGAFSPEADNPSQMTAMGLVSTPIQPFVQAAFNKNSFGGAIVRENDYSANNPDNKKMNSGTIGTSFDYIAQRLAEGGELLGARKYENDLSKVSPETLKHWWRTYTGGLGMFVADTSSMTSLIVTSPNSIEASDIPIYKKFVSDKSLPQLTRRFYEVADEIRELQDEKRFILKKAKDIDANIDFRSDPEIMKMVGLSSLADNTAKIATRHREQRAKILQSDLPTADKRAEIKKIEVSEEALYRRFMDTYKTTTKPKGEK